MNRLETSQYMLWCDHCYRDISPRREDDRFISCSFCGKVLLQQYSFILQSVSSDCSQPSKRNSNKEGLVSKQVAANANRAESSAETSPEKLLKKHSPTSKKKSKPIIVYDANGQNPLITQHEPDIYENDFNLRQDHKWDILNQQNVDHYSYDGDDEDDV